MVHERLIHFCRDEALHLTALPGRHSKVTTEMSSWEWGEAGREAGRLKEMNNGAKQGGQKVGA